MVEVIGPEAETLLDWLSLSDALAQGHQAPKARIEDMFLYRGRDTLLTRAAWIDGLGMAVKTASVFPGNADLGRPSVGGGVNLYSDVDGHLEAVVDFHLLTRWKTAGDSLLAARHLARSDSRDILIVGAGAVAASLIDSYRALFPRARFRVWNRNAARARALAHDRGGAWAEDLETAVRGADIVACATMATRPLILGTWLQPGQHIDLIGAFRPDMREADDAALRRGRLFVDSRETTLDHIGELKQPIERGVITRADVLGDFYDLSAGGFARSCGSEITVFKNGGGAHLDLITGRYILDRWRAHQAAGGGGAGLRPR